MKTRLSTLGLTGENALAVPIFLLLLLLSSVTIVREAREQWQYWHNGRVAEVQKQLHRQQIQQLQNEIYQALNKRGLFDGNQGSGERGGGVLEGLRDVLTGSWEIKKRAEDGDDNGERGVPRGPPAPPPPPQLGGGDLNNTEDGSPDRSPLLLGRGLGDILGSIKDVFKGGDGGGGFLDKVGDLLGGGDGVQGIISNIGQLLGGGEGGDIISQIGQLLGGLGGGGLDGALQSLGLFLGIGIGQGAAQGLDLAPVDMVNSIAEKVAADNDVKATGLNPLIQKAGLGLASTLIGSLGAADSTGGDGEGADDQSVQKKGLGGLDFDLTSIALQLAEGIGNGTVLGLNLASDLGIRPNLESGSIPDAAGAFGFGLAKSVASSFSINPDSVTQSLSLKALAQPGDEDASQTSRLPQFLPDLAAGLGSGIGEGVAIGLGLEMTPPPAGAKMRQRRGMAQDIDVRTISEDFGRGLTSKLVTTSTISMLGNLFSSQAGGDQVAQQGGETGDGGRQSSSLNIGLVAQGLAQGLLRGAGDAVDSVGGFKALIEGQGPESLNALPPVTDLEFDDSVKGAAVGFGLGLGGQGVFLARSAISSFISDDSVDDEDDDDAAGPEAATQKSPDDDADDASKAKSNFSHLRKRVTKVPRGLSVNQRDKSATVDLTKFITQEALSGVLQAGVSADIRLTNMESQMDSGLFSMVTASLMINGTDGAGFAVMLIFHVAFAIIVFLYVLPLAISLEAGHNILVRMDQDFSLPNAPRWNSIIWYFVITPFTAIILALGISSMGSAAHFRTGHGVFGLLTSILAIVAALLHFIIKGQDSGTIDAGGGGGEGLRHVRKAVNFLLLILAVLASLSGFGDLGTITLGLAELLTLQTSAIIGFGLAGGCSVGAALFLLDLYLANRTRKLRLRIGSDASEQGQHPPPSWI